MQLPRPRLGEGLENPRAVDLCRRVVGLLLRDREQVRDIGGDVDQALDIEVAKYLVTRMGSYPVTRLVGDQTWYCRHDDWSPKQLVTKIDPVGMMTGHQIFGDHP